jgi:monooxygenase
VPRQIGDRPGGPRSCRRHLGPVSLSRCPVGFGHVHIGLPVSPWTDPKAIADGPSILRYIHDTAKAFDVDKLIRLNYRVVNANWDSGATRWSVEVHRTDTDERLTISCSFLYVCTGYYRYDEGFSPKFSGVEHFTGR